MKIRAVLLVLTFLTLTSCSNQKNSAPEVMNNPTKLPPKMERDWKKYLPVKQLIEYRNLAPTISVVKTSAEPFNNLKYNKVIAYDYEGMEEAYNSIITNSGNYIPVVIRQQALNQKQIENVISFLTDKKTYGETTAACFNPHLAFVFYNDDAIAFKTDICLDCNYQNPSLTIPAMEHKKIELEDSDFYYAIGFTKYGHQKITDLCKEINFFYGN